MPSLPFPGLSKKMKDIHSLRYINNIKLTRKEIEAILPPLKSLRNAEKVAQTQSEKALEEERLALLEAAPDDPDPINSAPSVQIELERYRQTEQKTWREVEKIVGARKASMLQILVGRWSGADWGSPSIAPSTGFGASKGGKAPITNPFSAPSGAPVQPKPAAPPLPETPAEPVPVPKNSGEEEAVFAITQDLAPTPLEGQDTLKPQKAEAPKVAAGQAPLIAPGVAPQKALPANIAPAFPQPGQVGGLTFGGFAGFAGFPTRVNLSELVELLEQKLAAMKK